MVLTDLTADQQAQLAAFFVVYRPMMGEIAKTFGKLQRLEDAWNGGISAIVDSLDAGAVASADSPLAGVQPLVKESVTGTMTDFASAMVAFNADANRQRYIAAAGIQNTI